MRIVVRSQGVNLWLPVPLFLANTATFLMPEFVYAEIRKSVPEPFHQVVTRKVLREIVKECCQVIKRYKGLEIVHVEAQDGTFVSIRL